MKISRIVDKKGNRLVGPQLIMLEQALRYAFIRAGFNTHVAIDDSVIKIGLGMKSFTIDTKKRGSNADVSEYASRSPKGYKRTSTPTWEEREEFNHIINDTLDEMKLKANAKNSVLPIRTFEGGRIDCWDLYRFHGMASRAYYEIIKESELLKENESRAS